MDGWLLSLNCINCCHCAWLILSCDRVKRRINEVTLRIPPNSPKPYLSLSVIITKSQSPNSPHFHWSVQDPQAGTPQPTDVILTPTCRKFSPSSSKILNVRLCARLVCTKVALTGLDEPCLTHIGPHPRVWVVRELDLKNHSRAAKIFILCKKKN